MKIIEKLRLSIEMTVNSKIEEYMTNVDHTSDKC